MCGRSYRLKEAWGHEVSHQVLTGLEVWVIRLHGRKSVRQESVKDVGPFAALKVDGIAVVKDIVVLAVDQYEDGGLRKVSQKDFVLSPNCACEPASGTNGACLAPSPHARSIQRCRP